MSDYDPIRYDPKERKKENELDPNTQLEKLTFNGILISPHFAPLFLL